MVRPAIPRIPMIPVVRCPACPRAVSALSGPSLVYSCRSSFALSSATGQFISFLLLSQQWLLGTRHILPGGHLNCTVKSRDMSKQSTISPQVDHLSMAVTNVLKRKTTGWGSIYFFCLRVAMLSGTCFSPLRGQEGEARRGGGHA